MPDGNGFKKVRGNILAVIGKAGTRRVVGYNPKTQEVLLQDEKRVDSPIFPKHLSKIDVDMTKLLRAIG